MDEIKTFNKGLKPIGTPYWLTSLEKRKTQKSGSIIVCFATEEEANRAIKNRLYIAGISTRVEKYTSITSTTQYKKYQSYGYIDQNYKKSPYCRLYDDKHYINQYNCSIYKTKGRKYIYLEPKCINCKLSHMVDDKNYKVYIAIKGRLNSLIN